MLVIQAKWVKFGIEGGMTEKKGEIKQNQRARVGEDWGKRLGCFLSQEYKVMP